MPLITCPDCGKEISDAAPTCPGCGRPMIAAPTTVTTESTSKSLKAWNCICTLAFLVGAGIWVLGMTCAHDFAWAQWLGAPIGAAGLIGYVVNNFLIWWKHG